MPSLNPSFGYFQLEQTEVCEKAEEHPHIPSAACGRCSASGDVQPAGSELRFYGSFKAESSKSCQWILGVSLVMFRVQVPTQTHAEDDPSNPASSLVVSSNREQGCSIILYSVLENFQDCLYQTWCKPLRGFSCLLWSLLKIKTYSSYYIQYNKITHV